MPKSKGLCKFNQEWMKLAQYKDWLAPDPKGNEHEARCTLCCKTFKIGVGGRHHVDSHQKSTGHTKNTENLRKTPSIATMFDSKPTGSLNC